MELAKEIVFRTSKQMEIEDQKTDQKHINYALKMRFEEILRAIPKNLWD
jgi:hypothetical protein